MLLSIEDAEKKIASHKKDKMNALKAITKGKLDVYSRKTESISNLVAAVKSAEIASGIINLTNSLEELRLQLSFWDIDNIKNYQNQQINHNDLETVKIESKYIKDSISFYEEKILNLKRNTFVEE